MRANFHVRQINGGPQRSCKLPADYAIFSSQNDEAFTSLISIEKSVTSLQSVNLMKICKHSSLIESGRS